MEKQEIINEYEAAMFAANESGYAGMTAEQVIRNLVERAEAAEAKLAELTNQKPYAYEFVTAGKNQVILSRVLPPVDMLAVIPLFTRPAPSADLAGLVPDESGLADRHIAWLNTLQRPIFSDEDWEELTLYTWLAFRDSFRIYRAATLRKIEEAKRAVKPR